MKHRKGVHFSDLRFGQACCGVLAGGLLLAGTATLTPAYAGPCGGAPTDSANQTTCQNGSSGATLTYPASNPLYVNPPGGDFTLLLQNHDVNAAAGNGITFSGVVNGNGFITLESDSDVASGAGGDGINATATGGNTTITVKDTSSVAGAANGIWVSNSATGDVTVKTEAGSAVSGGTGDGINASSDTGTVTVETRGTVTTTDGFGISADVNTGTIKVDAYANVSGGYTGISATSATSGNVFVTTDVGTTVTGTTGSGIDVEALTSGNTEVTAKGAVTGNTYGILAAAVSGTSKVVTGAGAVEATDGFGIYAEGSGQVTVDTGGNVTSGTGANGIGIRANSTTSGDVLVTTTGAAGTLIQGKTGAGIFANAEGPGKVDVEVHTAVTGATIGIDANATKDKVEVTTDTAAILGKAGHGIDATAAGDVTVQTLGSVTGTGGSGINSQSSAGGLVQVATAGAAGTEILGTSGSGIDAGTSSDGAVQIQNSVRVLGSVAGITATSGGGNIKITNDSWIANSSLLDSDLAIQTTVGPTIIDNNVKLIGRVTTGVGADQLNNFGTWNTQGISDFGGGNDTVNNNNLIVAASKAGVAETTVFANLENLNNNSEGISLQDQTVGQPFLSDRLQTSGNYNGNGGGLAVDAFLGGPGSLADVLDVGGNVTGVTKIFVNDINAGAGGYDPNGILVAHADGSTTAADFVLANGPIDKGLFVYDLVFDAANGDHLLVGLPGRGVFETLAAVSSSQDIWRESADAWSTRQENLRDVLATRQVVAGVADPVVVSDDRPMGSLWVSALGSWAERDNDASVSLLNSSLNFDTSYKQDIYGFVGGADFQADMGGNTSMLFGLMGGYVDSKLNFDKSATSIDTSGGTVGAYAALMSGGFFTTVLIKADLLTMDYKVGSLATNDNDDANVTSWGVRGDMGYRLGDSLFAEPMLSVDGISTKIDRFSVGGADIDAGTNESFRGGAGIRLGYSDETIRASATARVWDVFSTDNEVDIAAGAPLDISDDGMEGVYGDFSGQIDVSLSSSVTAYVKGGILFSDDVTKPNASGGFAFYW